MKDLSLLVWLTQLGASVALPPAGFILLSIWLRNQFGWGQWILWVAIALGLICAIDGLRTSLKMMDRIVKKESDGKELPVSFNDHE